MPRNVRNFWLELDVDGRKNKIAAGPASKEGGFRLSIYMRDRGDVQLVGYIRGRAYGGDLDLAMELLEEQEGFSPKVLQQITMKGER